MGRNRWVHRLYRSSCMDRYVRVERRYPFWFGHAISSGLRSTNTDTLGRYQYTVTDTSDDGDRAGGDGDPDAHDRIAQLQPGDGGPDLHAVSRSLDGDERAEILLGD